MGTAVRKTSWITVFGAVNMDIGGTPFRPLVHRDSNPGTIRCSPGGVGRNIAHNLCLLGNRVRLVTAVGDDAYGTQLIDHCRDLGIDTGGSLTVKGGQTSAYLYLTQDDGEMECAVNDMRIYRYLTPEYIAERRHLLTDSELVAVDANLPEETIQAVCRGSRCPVFAEPVSCAKALRFAKVLDRIHTITPNLAEAEELTGRRINSEDPDSLAAAAEQLMCSGVKQVVITLGAGGCFFTDGNVARRIRPFPADMVNGNGAGDALFAGVATGFSIGLSFGDSVMLGMAAASITLETSLTNSPVLNLETAWQRANANKNNE